MTDQNMIECRACNGHGADPMSDNVNWLPCRSCNGVGKVYRKPATPAVDTLPDPDVLIHEPGGRDGSD